MRVKVNGTQTIDEWWNHNDTSHVNDTRFGQKGGNLLRGKKGNSTHNFSLIVALLELIIVIAPQEGRGGNTSMHNRRREHEHSRMSFRPQAHNEQERELASPLHYSQHSHASSEKNKYACTLKDSHSDLIVKRSTQRLHKGKVVEHQRGGADARNGACK